MRIEPQNFTLSENTQAKKSSLVADFDLDFRSKTLPGNAHVNERVTSQSGCTPGCGNTGTYNSFCC